MAIQTQLRLRAKSELDRFLDDLKSMPDAVMESFKENKGTLELTAKNDAQEIATAMTTIHSDAGTTKIESTSTAKTIEVFSVDGAPVGKRLTDDDVIGSVDQWGNEVSIGVIANKIQNAIHNPIGADGTLHSDWLAIIGKFHGLDYPASLTIEQITAFVEAGFEQDGKDVNDEMATEIARSLSQLLPELFADNVITTIKQRFNTSARLHG